MKFTVRGIIESEATVIRKFIQDRVSIREATVTWEDGSVTGDAQAIDCLQLEAVQVGEIGLVNGPFYYGDFLNNPVATFLLLEQRVFTEIVELSGDPIPGLDSVHKRLNLPEKLSELSYRDAEAALLLLREWGKGTKPVSQLWTEAVEALGVRE